MRKTLKKNETGITLVALVVTIIVLLILATVSINLVLGENGIITRGTNTKDETTHQMVAEKMRLEHSEYYIDVTTHDDAETFISYLNRKGYIDNDGVVNIEELCGQKLAFGNGSIDTGDAYILIENETEYVLTYFNSNSEEKVICQIPSLKNTYSNELKNIKVGDYILYTYGEGNGAIGRVLYDANSEYGLQVMLLDIIDKTVVEYQNDTLEGWVDSYNNAIIDLIEASKNILNPDLAVSARPLGTNPINPYLEGELIKMETGDGDYYLKGEDTNYIDDANVLIELEGTVSRTTFCLKIYI